MATPDAAWRRRRLARIGHSPVRALSKEKVKRKNGEALNLYLILPLACAAWRRRRLARTGQSPVAALFKEKVKREMSDVLNLTTFYRWLAPPEARKNRAEPSRGAV